MTKNIIIVPGSVRKNSVASALSELALNEMSRRDDVSATVVDLAELKLPFFDNQHMPAHPEFTETDPQVAAWTKMVNEADGVLFVTPEYNRNLSAIQKNAIDWIYKEWQDKPVSTINYGFGGGAKSLEGLDAALNNVKANFLPTGAQLFFTKDINPDGSVINSDHVAKQLSATVNELVDAAV